jgi:transglutaminase-like putative cysteine protease
MKYRITHRTVYAYSQPVARCHSEARLQPRQTTGQACLSSVVTIDPEPADRAERHDFFGNRVLYFAVQKAHEQLAVTGTSEIEMVPSAPPDLEASPPWDELRDGLKESTDAETRAARQYVLDSTCVVVAADAAAYAAQSFAPARPIPKSVFGPSSSEMPSSESR